MMAPDAASQLAADETWAGPSIRLTADMGSDDPARPIGSGTEYDPDNALNHSENDSNAASEAYPPTKRQLNSVEKYVPWTLGEDHPGIFSFCVPAYVAVSMLFTVAALGFLVVHVAISLANSKSPGQSNIAAKMEIFFSGSLFAPMFGMFNVFLLLAGLFGAWAGYHEPHKLKRLGMWLAALGFFAVFVWIPWLFCVARPSINAAYTLPANGSLPMDGGDVAGCAVLGWSTGILPKSSSACAALVAVEQAPLFSTEIYKTQFARTYQTYHDGHIWRRLYPAFDWQGFHRTQRDTVLCGQGFKGDVDLYGLGTRCGVYMQWLSSLLANNFLLKSRTESQKVYLAFSLAMCLATLVASFARSCTFGVEIEILYWMYWGGYVCVFGSAPCSVRLGRVRRWVQLDWTTALLFTTHWIMTYHALWYVWRAYDQVFARMPCGTWHFFLGPIMDPSVGFWRLRDYFGPLTSLALPFVGLAFPLVALLMVPETTQAILEHRTFRVIFGVRPDAMDREQQVDNEAMDDAQEAGVTLGRRLLGAVRSVPAGLRALFGLPASSRGGIRLVTPADMAQRRLLRIRWALVALLAFVLSITAIELMLKGNKIQGVYSLASAGQYVPLTVGIYSLGRVCLSLAKQEGERRHRRRCHLAASQGLEDYELHSISSAVGHAFAQPDADLYLMSGALPGHLDDAGQDITEQAMPPLSRASSQ